MDFQGGLQVVKILIMFWPLYLLLGALAILSLVPDVLGLLLDRYRIYRKFQKGQKWRSDRELIAWLRDMRPSEFEDYVAELFRKMGYSADAVGRSHDGGIDVIIHKDGKTGYIQCKKFYTSKVTVGELRDFYGALADRLTNAKAYFVTTNVFTREAEEFAEDKPIELVDQFDLVKYIRSVEKDGKSIQDSARGAASG